jgi:flagellar biosynthesis/type III secretory pathway protein FliH
VSVIKNTEARATVRPAVLDLGDLKRQGEQALEHARREAQRIVAAARAEAQAIVSSAAQRGFEEGRERGLEEGRAEGRSEGRAEALAGHGAQIEALLGAWNDAIERFESQRCDLLHAVRRDVVALAIAIARKIAHRTVAADPSVVVDQVAEALALVASRTAATVSVNPRDRPLLESVLERLVERFRNCTHIRLRDDPQVSPGGCIVATERGLIDGTLESQIECITEALGAAVDPGLGPEPGGP